MARRSRQVMATFAVSALLAGGAVAHAATSSSGPAKSTSTQPAAVMDENAATHSSSNCPNMGGDSTPSTTPSTTPSSSSGTSSTSTAV